ncbi:MAG: hypothetical protein RR659_04110 [Bacilli bacterium]
MINISIAIKPANIIFDPTLNPSTLVILLNSVGNIKNRNKIKHDNNQTNEYLTDILPFLKI